MKCQKCARLIPVKPFIILVPISNSDGWMAMHFCKSTCALEWLQR